ncbi:MAG: uL30 family ribosomal protein [Candidatus Micrarchaeota archaeon]|nr:uL30 family ribosomal protein [Candidatus Micrarchaeota archaeon]
MKENGLNGKLIAIVRIRGRVNVRSDIKETLERLRLPRVNNCSIVKMNDSYYGMLKNCVNHVAFGEIDEATLKKLLEKRAEGLDIKQVESGDTKAMKEAMPLRLHPPKHGYRSTKLSVKQGGSLGYMGSGINNLIGRMI